MFVSPLSCWDIYSTFLESVNQAAEDVLKLTELAKSNRWKQSIDFKKELVSNDHVIVVTNADLKIVHSTYNMLEMNGYTNEEVLGKRPSIFQGKDTCQITSARIRTAIRNEQAFEEVLTNYKKDGSAYKCWIKGVPVHDYKGKLVNFIAFERYVA
ncbi:PAS domain-containing protein [Spongiivirga citrea]|uniref:PAS domain-containing protein n=1 Tax=Spongiivirga citrea TaxID=1481457 RepID=A0A6M0CI51_9FLAO|nr:PAS domain-containing protein [Spongiivirga citrea]NER17202.1 PAS domain-containing protein [Spongiivirga citrea]